MLYEVLHLSFGVVVVIVVDTRVTGSGSLVGHRTPTKVVKLNLYLYKRKLITSILEVVLQVHGITHFQ
jgi:hypothetical protein